MSLNALYQGAEANSLGAGLPKTPGAISEGMSEAKVVDAVAAVLTSAGVLLPAFAAVALVVHEKARWTNELGPKLVQGVGKLGMLRGMSPPRPDGVDTLLPRNPGDDVDDGVVVQVLANSHYTKESARRMLTSLYPKPSTW